MTEERGSTHETLPNVELARNSKVFKSCMLTDKAMREESSLIENSIKSGSFYFDKYSSSN